MSRADVVTRAHMETDTAFLGKLDGVTEYVYEDLAQLVNISHDVLWDIVDHLYRERQLFLVRPDAKHHLEIFEKDEQVKCRKVQRRAAGFDFRHFQNIIDQ